MAEGAASAEPALFVKADRCRLKGSRLKPEHRFASISRLLLDTCEQCLANAPPARCLARIHALDLRIIVEERDRPAADRLSAEPRHKEADMRLEHLLDRQAVALLRLVNRAEHPVQFRNQRYGFGCGAG